MKDDKLYLIHIQECLDRIKEYIAGGKAAFFDDSKTQDAVLRNLQVMAESTQRLSAKLKGAHPGVPWQDISGFRNVLAHDYLGINLARVWEIVESNLPALENKVEALLREYPPPPSDKKT